MDIKQALAQSSNVLFMSHLALGDYLYQRSFLIQLCQHYPTFHLDVWFDDFRKKNKAWSRGRTDIMGQWLKTEPFIRDFFPIASDNASRESMVNEAAKRNYDVVIVLASSRSGRFYQAARRIAPNAYCVALKPSKVGSLTELWHYRKMDKLVDIHYASPPPILSLYAERFSKLCGFDAKPQLAQLDIPHHAVQQVSDWLRRQLADSGCTHTLLINTVSTTSKRDYPWAKMERVIAHLHQSYPNVLFVINAPPHERRLFEQRTASLHNQGVPAACFTAQESVFEIAALVSQMNAVVSVETAIMHFAEVMKTPQIVMIRRQTSHWQPANANGVIVSDKYVSAIDEAQIIATFKASLAAFISPAEPNREYEKQDQ